MIPAVKTIVASFHPDLARELDRDLLRRQDLRLVTVRSTSELLERLRQGADLCFLGRTLSDGPASAACQAIRSDKRTALLPVVLLLTHAPSQGTPVADAAHGLRGGRGDFDEVLDLPAPPGALALLCARFLGVPLREGERFAVRVHVFSEGQAEGDAARADGPPPDQYLGTTVDLSEVGLLLKTRRRLARDERLALRFSLPGQPGEIDLRARVVRIDDRAFAPDLAAAFAFETLHEAHRRALREYLTALTGGRPFRWHITRELDRTLITLSGVLRQGADMTELSQLRGELDFHLRDFRRISSDSIQTWLDLIRSLRLASRIRLHECPTSFVQQANAISNLLDQTQVVSFYAPYLCPRCGLDEERLIDVQRDLGPAQGRGRLKPPSFPCQSCGATLAFDDLPERYFAFL